MTGMASPSGIFVGGVFAGGGPRWFSIPSGRSFLDDLARGLWAELGDELSNAQILTPTRRGARAMALAFSGLAEGSALLLPQIRAIGDLDEGEPPFDLERYGLDLPPALSPLRRRFELARLILEHYRPNASEALSPKSALEHAEALSGFFDSLALEEIDASDKLDRLIYNEAGEGYVLDAFAEHWQTSAHFLKLAVDQWPKRLAALGLMDPSQRQVVLIRRLRDQWAEHPPQNPTLLVGSTGTAPAMADLMQTIALAPKGAVVLPGLDQSLSDAAWNQVEDQHPQGAMKRLLSRHKLTRGDVKPWRASEDGGRAQHWRRRLINEALRPAEATKDWLVQIGNLKAEAEGAIETGLDGLTLIEAAKDEEAASVIALIMRETLETPDKTVALITPDMALARRVSARLTRWGLAADSSAGLPLSHSPTGQFLLGALELVLDPCNAVAALGFFKHPYHVFGAEAEALEALEIKGLRGAKPISLQQVTQRLATYPAALGLWARFVDMFHQHWKHPPTDLSGLVETLVRFCEAMAIEGGQVLWSGAGGASAAALLAEIMAEGAGFAIEHLHDGTESLTRLITQTTVRTGGNTHPRLFILGALEARLVKADRLILAGLEEGVWPQAAPLDPFLSRPMRKQLGLPSPERRTGLSAHDFVQAVSAPEVMLITRKRREGEPQVSSRWIWRLKTLCQGADIPIPMGHDWLDWARQLDEATVPAPKTLMPAQRPEPRPPVALRPKAMAVTEVELFARDPYAIYAKRILGLRKLDRPHEPFEAMQRGTAIHKAAERFVAEEVPLGDAGREGFARLIEQELVAANLSPGQMALQRPFISDLAENYVGFEEDRRAAKPRLMIEQQSEMSLTIKGETFTLKAKADRIEVREDGIDILDFKTGNAPGVKEVLAGYSAQLTLTAAIIRHGGFEGIGTAKSIGELAYVLLKPDDAKLKLIRDRKVPQTGDEMAEVALKHLTQKLIRYADPAQPYRSWTAPKFRKERGGDYDHLARLYEWDVLGDEVDEPVDEEGADL